MAPIDRTSSSSASSTRTRQAEAAEQRAREAAAAEKQAQEAAAAAEKPKAPAAPVRDGMDDGAARKEAVTAASRGLDTFSSVELAGPSAEADADASTGLATVDLSASASANLGSMTATLPAAGGTATVSVVGPAASAGVSAELSPRAYEGSAEVSLETVSASVSGTTESGISYEGDISGPSLSADVSASAELGWDGVEAKVEVEVNATLVDASGSISKSVSFEVAGEQYEVEVALEASGRIAAEGKITLDIDIGTDGTVKIEPGADGFAGIEASLNATVEVSHEGKELATAEVDLTGRLGTGFTPDVDGDIKLGADGVLEFEASAATPNVSVELEAKVDTAAVGNAALETAESFIFGPSDPNAAPPQGVEFDATYAFGA